MRYHRIYRTYLVENVSYYILDTYVVITILIRIVVMALHYKFSSNFVFADQAEKIDKLIR